MDQTPDTLNFMIGGYAVLWAISFAFIVSLWLRTRNLEKDTVVLKELVDSERQDED